MYSPLTRGCFFHRTTYACLYAVFPAHAGVFLCSMLSACFTLCIPRSRGGVSAWEAYESALKRYSPLTRGCFSRLSGCGHRPIVFPAHAGVFPACLTESSSPVRIPRSRGGVSQFIAPFKNQCTYSPLTRGCFCTGRSCQRPSLVFPAHAGVFLSNYAVSRGGISIPRSRGGVSLSSLWGEGLTGYSPLTRGCFPS